MQEVIQKMLEVEDEGRRLVQQARREAREAVELARQEAELRARQAVEQARLDAADLVAQAAADAQREKQRLLGERLEHLHQTLQVDPSDVEQAAEAVRRAVLGLQ
jgi:vacuolar-type H+-ATPase subunit H